VPCIYRVYFVLPFACICVNYDIDVVIQDIVCESR
jgi:hypothetical protein